MALLILLQYVITWLSVRSKGFQRLIKAEPTLLLRRGEFLPAALRAQRITRDDVLAAIRADGSGDLSQIEAVVLETDGSISVIGQAPDTDSTLTSVAGAASKHRVPTPVLAARCPKPVRSGGQ